MKQLIWFIILIHMLALASAFTCSEYRLDAPDELSCGGDENRFALGLDAAVMGFASVDVQVNATLPLDTSLSSGPSLIELTDDYFLFDHTIFLSDGFMGTINPVPWTLSCSEPGNYEFVIVIDEQQEPFTHCEKTFSYEVDSSSLQVPSIEVLLPHIPVLAMNENYPFNITVHNNGSIDIYNFSARLSDEGQLNQSEISFDNVSGEALAPGQMRNFSIRFSSEHSALSENILVNLEQLNEQFFSYLIAQSNNFRVVRRPELLLSDDVLHQFQQPTSEGNHTFTTGFGSVEEFEIALTLITDGYEHAEEINLNIASSTQDVIADFENFSTGLEISWPENWTGSSNITLVATEYYGLNRTKSFMFYVENSSSEICDGVDNDGDSLVDEEEYDRENSEQSCIIETIICEDGEAVVLESDNFLCEADQNTVSINSGGNNNDIVEDDSIESAQAQISWPPDGEVFELGDVIDIVAQTSGNSLYTDYEWSIDGTTYVDFRIPDFVLSSPGYLTIRLTVILNDGQTEDYDEVRILVKECDSALDCEQELCCQGVCRDPYCEVDQDCYSPNYASYVCEVNLDDQCQSSCSHSLCEPECVSDLDCDDGVARTVDTCTQSDNPCEIICHHEALDLEVFILSPERTTYDSLQIPFIVETSDDADCRYQLNDGSWITIFSQNFEITAQKGNNNLWVRCEDFSGIAEEKVAFSVVADDSSEKKSGKEDPESVLMHKISPEILQEIFKEIISNTGLSYKKEVSRSNHGSTTIYTHFENNLPTTLYNVSVVENISKEYVNHTSLITSENSFRVIQEDPVIEFIIPRIEAYQKVSLSYTVQKELDPDDIKGFQTIVSPEIGELEQEEFFNLQAQTQEAVEIRKRTEKTSNESKYFTTIVPKKAMENVDVYLNIPKCMAEEINGLHFKNENFRVIAEDPLIMWHFSDLNESVTIDYVLEGLVDEDCENKATVVAVARIIGDELGSESEDNLFMILLPIIMVPLTIFIIFLVYRLNHRKEHYSYWAFCRVDPNDPSKPLIRER